MAATERVSLIPMSREIPKMNLDKDHFMPGIRVMVRTTTASLSDYPEWNMDELLDHKKSGVVTNGACS